MSSKVPLDLLPIQEEKRDLLGNPLYAGVPGTSNAYFDNFGNPVPLPENIPGHVDTGSYTVVFNCHT